MSETEQAATPGIERPAVDEFLTRECGLAGPYSFELIAGGRSNLTYRVTCGDERRVVLRRPPTGNVLPSAHDMAREHRIIAALGPTSVPVAEALGFCDDPELTGGRFYVMAEVDGLVVRDDEVARSLDPTVRARSAGSLVDVLAALHDLDPDQVGLGDLGRREAYVERQLRRWHAQWQQSQTRPLPLVDEVHQRLADAVPEQHRSVIAHGDYRLDNVMVDAAGELVAVFDWELCTLGDPLADLGSLLCYWGEAGDPFLALPSTPTVVEGFPTRLEVAERYATAAGLPLDDLPFYVAFGNWKLACILEGVHARYRAGVMGERPDDLDDYATRVEQLADRAHAVLSGGAI